MRVPFLSAEWKNILLLSWEIHPDLLKKYCPRGTELDFYENKAFVSLVAFHFNRIKLFGLIPIIPSSFPEINLRFYVKKSFKSEIKRAVTFVKEIVPSRLISSVARLIFNEPYVAKQIKAGAIGSKFTYTIVTAGNNITIEAESEAQSRPLKNGSLEEFILEHYWGYCAQADAATVEYQVAHTRWEFSKIIKYSLPENINELFAPEFSSTLANEPCSVILTAGSKVKVSMPRRFFQPLEKAKPLGWVLYDGTCGFCSEWIPFWKKPISKAGYSCAPIQTEWVKDRLKMSELELNSDIRLLLNDGTLINGADAYLYGMKQVWWAYPFGLVLSLPVLRQVTWFFYKIFNHNRFFVSKVCGFKPEL